MKKDNSNRHVAENIFDRTPIVNNCLYKKAHEFKLLRIELISRKP